MNGVRKEYFSKGKLRISSASKGFCSQRFFREKKAECVKILWSEEEILKKSASQKRKATQHEKLKKRYLKYFNLLQNAMDLQVQCCVRCFFFPL